MNWFDRTDSPNVCAIFSWHKRLFRQTMHKFLFVFALISLWHSGFSQRLSQKIPSPVDSTITKYIPRTPSIDIEIKKYDPRKTTNLPNYEVFTLSVFNNTDSTICILFSFDLIETVKNHVFALDPVY